MFNNSKVKGFHFQRQAMLSFYLYSNHLIQFKVSALYSGLSKRGLFEIWCKLLFSIGKYLSLDSNLSFKKNK